MTTDVAAICAGLTKAQREAVTGPRWRWLTLDLALEWPMCGTVERMPEAPNFWQATPLGKRVRAALQQNGESCPYTSAPRREGDEWACRCGKRWPVGEEHP